jgi:hypothetical protein
MEKEKRNWNTSKGKQLVGLRSKNRSVEILNWKGKKLYVE